MLNLPEKLLQRSRYYVQSSEFTDIYNSHPNYPSLYAITDSFTQLGIENAALRIDKELLNELPNYFIAKAQIPKMDSIVLITKEKDYVIIEDPKQKQKLSFDEFKNYWDGVVVLVEENITSSKTKELLSKKNLSFLLLLPVILIPYLKGANTFSIYFLINQIISVLGFIVGYLIIEKALYKTSSLGDAICNVSTKTDCDSSFKSDYSTLPGNIPFKNLPITFFLSNLLYLAFFNNLSTIFFYSLIGSPIILYSIYLQAFKIKSWCVLCLLTSFFFISYIGVAIGFNSFSSLKNLLITDELIYVLIGVITYFSISQMVDILNNNQTVKQENYEFKRFKNDIEIFNSFTKPVEQPEVLETLKFIKIGKSESAQLSLFLSPYCGHCHKAFKDAMELLDMVGEENITINIGFNVNVNNPDSPSTKILKNLYQIYLSKPEKIKEALSDWHITNLESNKWFNKWELSITDDSYITQQLENQYDWCRYSEFNYTPVKLINNKQFPSQYKLEDLKYLINELEIQPTSPTPSY